MGKFFLIVAAIAAISTAGNSVKFSSEYFQKSLEYAMASSSYYRLNLTVYPLSYTLSMRPVLDDGFPSLEKFTAPSSVSIKVRSVSNTSASTITMHQRDLKIYQEGVVVTNLNTGEILPVASQEFELQRDLYTLHLEKPFQPGDILNIYIPYTVTLSQIENVGIYLGHYVDPATNQTKYLSTTKLEPYHARKVFPLFDEPSLKATFKITVGRLDGKYHSLSNMEILSTEDDLEYPGWVWDHYQETVLMSPYLVCMIVSDFASESVVDDRNRTISAWAPKHDIDLNGGVYGAVTGEKILRFFENKFKMDYVLPKLDAVALPQFASGAMENFGLVTYRYGYLVWIPGENTEAERRKITQVLAHEIVHQWYGNIVTCAWWSDIWLNEGFARFLQFWAMHDALPEFMIEDAFVNDATQLAMVFDQEPNTHPVKNSAESPTESAAVFDRIAYEKGASLLKMMEWFMTKPVFDAGIIDIYLQRMKWSSAYQDDLFEALQNAVDQHSLSVLPPPRVTIKTVMDTWTLQSGYPLVRVGVIDQETISLSQEKFQMIATTPKFEDGWWIPVKVAAGQDFHSKNLLPDIWIPDEVNELQYTREDLNTSNLIMVNPDASGYYRVLYDAALSKHIVRQLSSDHTLISSSSRSQLLDDYFNLAWANYIEVESALEMTKYLGKEIASNVWTAVLTNLKPVLSKFTQAPLALSAFQKYFVPRLESSLASIGLRQLPGEKGINVTLRAQLLDLACQLKMADCLEYATELLDEWKSKPETNPFPVDIQSTLYCAAVSASTAPNTLNFMLERFLEARKDSQKTPLLNALACSADVTVLENLLEMSVTSLSKHTSQILTQVAVNPLGRTLVYEFIKDKLLQEQITPDIFASVVGTLTTYWKEDRDIEQLELFIDSNRSALDPVLPQLRSSLANVQTTITWWSSFGLRIQTWMENQSTYVKSSILVEKMSTFLSQIQVI